MSYDCKNCGELMNVEDWERYYGLCYKCFMFGNLEKYISNNVDNALETKRGTNNIEK